MRDKEASCEDVVIHPTTITNRLSTDIYSTGDPYILVALKYIHQNLATKITVEDVVRQVPLSRRLLESILNRLQEVPFISISLIYAWNAFHSCYWKVASLLQI